MTEEIHDTLDEIEDKSCEFASKVYAEKRDDATIVLGAVEHEHAGVIPHVYNKDGGHVVDATAGVNTLTDDDHLVVKGDEHPHAVGLAEFETYEEFKNSDEWHNAQELAQEAL